MNPLKKMCVTCPFGWRIHPIYGDRRFHHGVDLRASTGTEIYAVLNGMVASVKTDSVNGLSVRIDHGHGIVSFYAHLSASKVELGQLVTEGQVIALSGNTGLSTGPHLHFGIYVDGKSVDPLKLLKESEERKLNIEKIVIRKEGKEYEGLLIDGIAYGVVRPLFESQGQRVTWREADKEVVISDGPLEKLRDIKMIVEGVK